MADAYEGDDDVSERIAIEGRLWSKIAWDAETDCWLWTGCLSHDGYAKIKIAGRTVYAHRIAYELLVGPIESGRELDHECHSLDRACDRGSACPHRRCCNPAHLKPVTQAENMRRIVRGLLEGQSDWAPRTHCIRGHEYTSESTGWQKSGRYCKRCKRMQYLARRSVLDIGPRCG